MGIDPARLLNHGMKYRNAEELLQYLEKRTGIPARLNAEDDSIDYNKDNWWVMPAFHLPGEITNDTDFEIVRYERGTEAENILISPHLLEYDSEDAYMGRWSGIKFIADSIREHGLPGKDHLTDKEHPAAWQFAQRRNLYDSCKKFGASAMIIFCEDLHQEWLDHLTDGKWTFEMFIEWGKSDFIFVRFQDLIHFEFPNSKPDYYNVFIYDDFEDLKGLDK